MIRWTLGPMLDDNLLRKSLRRSPQTLPHKAIGLGGAAGLFLRRCSASPSTVGLTIPNGTSSMTDVHSGQCVCGLE